MKVKQKQILVLTTHALRDPLTEGLVLHFLKACSHVERKFLFITFESASYRLSSKEVTAAKEQMKKQWNIEWHPMPYEEGSVLRPTKFLSLLFSFVRMFFLVTSRRPSLALGVCTPASCALYLATSLSRAPLSVYAFEPHAELMRELRVWKKGSANFRILSKLERRVAMRAAHIMTGTDAMIELLRAAGSNAHMHKVPTGSNAALFSFDASVRDDLRTQWNAQEKIVMAYVGKFGGLYLSEELIEFFASLYRANDRFFFMILSPNTVQEITNWCSKAGLPESAYVIGRSSLNDLKNYLSASDIGVIAYADIPSRKYCSPTKAGNYLMCGLPMLVQRNTSEDDLLVERFKVGVVVENFDPMGASLVADRITIFLEEDRMNIRDRCISTGMTERGNDKAIEVIEDILRAI